MSDNFYVLGVLGAMALTTFALRALPFVAAQWLQRHAVVKRLGDFLPLAIMTLLVVHSAVGSALTHDAGPWPELAAVALTVAVQWRGRNALLSIVVGTALYVLLRNFSGF